MADPSKHVYLDLVLEGNPKWKLLSEILQEISTSVEKATVTARGGKGGGKGKGKGKGKVKGKGKGKEQGDAEGTNEPSGDESGVMFTEGDTVLTDPDVGGATVLVVVKDERTCHQLTDFLTRGSRQIMATAFDRCAAGCRQRHLLVRCCHVRVCSCCACQALGPALCINKAPA